MSYMHHQAKNKRQLGEVIEWWTVGNLAPLAPIPRMETSWGDWCTLPNSIPRPFGRIKRESCEEESVLLTHCPFVPPRFHHSER